MTKDDDGGREFTARALARLPAMLPPPGLAAVLLAAYDARTRPWFHRASDLIWPGAPVWALGAALAVSLLVGTGLGMMAPAMLGTFSASTERSGFSLDDPPSVSFETLLAADGP